jgi:hypothetical protein
MSIKIMAAVWDRNDLSQSETLVALALADHADDEGECWPSIDRIATKARIGDRQTQRVIQRLEALGLIQVERAVGRRNTNCYRFTLDAIKGDTVTPLPDTAKGVMGDAEKVSPGTQKVSLDATKGDIAKSPESSITIIEPSEEPSGLDREAWGRFFEYRKKIGKTIKPASTLAAKRQLAAFGADQPHVVEQTIANGWQGIFALKSRDSPGSNGVARPRLTRYEQMQEALRNATET